MIKRIWTIVELESSEVFIIYNGVQIPLQLEDLNWRSFMNVLNHAGSTPAADPGGEKEKHEN